MTAIRGPIFHECLAEIGVIDLHIGHSHILGLILTGHKLGCRDSLGLNLLAGSQLRNSIQRHGVYLERPVLITLESQVLDLYLHFVSKSKVCVVLCQIQSDTGCLVLYNHRLLRCSIVQSAAFCVTVVADDSSADSPVFGNCHILSIIQSPYVSYSIILPGYLARLRY